MRPVEIWNMTADVTEGDGYYIMHVVTSENEYDYGLCDDGNAYFYDADSGELTDQLVYTYTFEKGRDRHDDTGRKLNDVLHEGRSRIRRSGSSL